MNRLTITLPDDLYAMARAYAVANRKSISKAIGDLLRRGQESGPRQVASPIAESPSVVHPVSGFPMIELREGITMQDIQRSLDDEDVRHMEMMGLSPEEIERALAR